MQIFLSDLQEFKLDYEERGDRYAVKGLPVLRTGTFKGMEFDAERLAGLVQTFDTVKAADGWMPPVRPRHPTQDEWENDTWDTTQNLGVVEALRFDEQADALLADIEVDAATFGKMRGGNVRYNSSEFADYQSPNTETVYEDILRGVAFVDNPAVKNVQWAFVMNADDFRQPKDYSAFSMGDLSADQLRTKIQEELSNRGNYANADDKFGPWVRELFENYIIVEWEGDHYRHGYSVAGIEVMVAEEGVKVKQTWTTASGNADGLTTPQTKGGVKTMNFIDKLKEKLGLTEEQVGKLDEMGLAKQEGDDIPEEQPAALSAGPVAPPVKDKAPESHPDVVALRAQVELANKDTKALRAEVTVMQDAKRVGEAKALVEEMTREGIVPPSCHQQAFLLYNALGQDKQTVTVLAAEGEEPQEQRLADVLTELLTRMTPDVPVELRGAAWQGDEGDLTGEAKLTAMHGTGLEEDPEADAFAGIEKTTQE